MPAGFGGTAIGSAHVILGVDPTHLMRGLASAKASLLSFSKVANVAAIAVGVGLAVGLAKCVSAAAEFQQSMAMVKSVTGASVQQFDALTKKAKELGRITKWTMIEISAGMENLGRAGFAVNEIIDSIAGVSNLAASQMMTLEAAADMTASAIRAFGLAAEDSTRVADVFAYAASNSAARVEGLSEALSYAAPLARAAGFSIEGTVAAIGKLSDVSIRGSRAGTALRFAIAELIGQTDQFKDKLKGVGMSMDELLDTQGNLKSFADIIGIFEAKGYGAAEMVELFGKRAGPGLAALVQMGSASLKQLTVDLEAAGGTAALMAEIQLDTLSGQMTILKGSISLLATSIGETLLPVLQKIVQQGLIPMINKWVDWIENIKPYIVAGFKTLYLYITKNREALVFLFKQFLGFAKVIGLIWLATKAFHIMTSPIYLLIALAGALYVAWRANLFNIQKLVSDTVTFIVDKLNLSAILEHLKEGEYGLAAAEIALDIALVLGTVTLAKGMLAALALKIGAMGLGLSAAAIMPTIGIGLLLATTLGLQMWLDAKQTTIDGSDFSLDNMAVKLTAALAAFGLVFAVSKNVMFGVIAANLVFHLTPSFELLSEGAKEVFRTALIAGITALAGAIGGYYIASSAAAAALGGAAVGGPVGAVIGAIAGLTLGLIITLIPKFEWFSKAVEAIGNLPSDLYSLVSESISNVFAPGIDAPTAAFQAATEEAKKTREAIEDFPDTSDMDLKFEWIGDAADDMEDLTREAKEFKAILEDMPSLVPGIGPGSGWSPFGSFFTRQQGGFVPGKGLGDMVPAMLEPGEFVVPNWMMKIGWLSDLIKGIWSGGKKMRAGGPTAGAGYVAGIATSKSLDTAVSTILGLLESLHAWIRPMAEDKEYIDQFFSSITQLVSEFGNLDNVFADLLATAEEQAATIEEQATAITAEAEARAEEIDAIIAGTDTIEGLLTEFSKLKTAFLSAAEGSYEQAAALEALIGFASKIGRAIDLLGDYGKVADAELMGLVASLAALGIVVEEIAAGGLTLRAQFEALKTAFSKAELGSYKQAVALGDLEGFYSRLTDAVKRLGEAGIVADTELMDLVAALEALGFGAAERAAEAARVAEETFRAKFEPVSIAYIKAMAANVEALTTEAKALETLHGVVIEESEVTNLIIGMKRAYYARLEALIERTRMAEQSTAALEKKLWDAKIAFGDLIETLSDVILQLSLTDLGAGIERLMDEATLKLAGSQAYGDFLATFSEINAVLSLMDTDRLERIFGAKSTWPVEIQDLARRIWEDLQGIEGSLYKSGETLKETAARLQRDAEEAARRAQEAFRAGFDIPAMEALRTGDWSGAVEAIRIFAQTRGDLTATAAALSDVNGVVIDQAEVLNLISGSYSKLASNLDTLIAVTEIAGEDTAALEEMRIALEEIIDPLGALKKVIRDIVDIAREYPTMAGSEFRALFEKAIRGETITATWDIGAPLAQATQEIVGSMRATAEAIEPLAQVTREVITCAGGICTSMTVAAEAVEHQTLTVSAATQHQTQTIMEATSEVVKSLVLSGESYADIYEAAQGVASMFEQDIKALEYFGFATDEAEAALDEFRAAIMGITVEMLHWQEWLEGTQFGPLLEWGVAQMPGDWQQPIQDFLQVLEPDKLDQIMAKLTSYLGKAGETINKVVELGTAILTGDYGQIILSVMDLVEEAAEKFRAAGETVYAFITTKLTAAFNKLTAIANNLASSFKALFTQTENYRRLQAAFAGITQMVFNALLGFLLPLIALLESLFGAVDAVIDVIDEETEARMASLNVPTGYKVTRAEWEAAMPGVPGILITPPGGGEPGELPEWFEDILHQFADEIEIIMGLFKQFGEILIEVWETLTPLIIEAVLPALTAFASDLVELAEEIRDKLLPVLAEHLPGILADIISIFGDLLIGITTFAVNLTAQVLPGVADFVHALAGVADNLPDLGAALADALGPVIDTLTAAFAGVATWIANSFLPGLIAFLAAFGAFWEIEIDPWLVEVVFPKLVEWGTKLYELFKKIVDYLTVDIWEDYEGGLLGFIQGDFWNAIQEAFGTIANTIDYIITTLEEQDIDWGEIIVGMIEYWADQLSALMEMWAVQELIEADEFGAALAMLWGAGHVSIWDKALMTIAIAAMAIWHWLEGFSLGDLIFAPFDVLEFVITDIVVPLVSWFITDIVAPIVFGILDIVGKIAFGIWDIVTRLVGWVITDIIAPLGAWIWETIIVGPSQWVWENILSPVGAFIMSALKWPFNAAIAVINGIIGVINWALGWLGVHVPTVPYLEKGGQILSEGLVYAHRNEVFLPAALTAPLAADYGQGGVIDNRIYLGDKVIYHAMKRVNRREEERRTGSTIGGRAWRMA